MCGLKRVRWKEKGRVDIRRVNVIFFFQAEDGIRDWSVTGVQTCALPICHDIRMGIDFHPGFKPTLVTDIPGST